MRNDPFMNPLIDFFFGTSTPIFGGSNSWGPAPRFSPLVYQPQGAVMDSFEFMARMENEVTEVTEVTGAFAKPSYKMFEGCEKLHSDAYIADELTFLKGVHSATK